MRKMLVPFDGSDNALRAVRYAATSWQANPSFEIELLHVLDPMTLPAPSALTHEVISLPLPCADEAASVLQPARQLLDQGGISYHAHYRVGAAAANDIAEQVHETGCDGVIMGTRGMSPVAALMIGSVAARVINLVDVPLTLIK